MVKRLYWTFRARGVVGVLDEVLGTRWSIPRQRLASLERWTPAFASGIGLEIGGPSRIFAKDGCVPLYPIAERIDNCNFGHETVWRDTIVEGRTFVFDDAKAPGVQYIAEAADLEGIDDASYDFVLSSHCIEHLADPLQGLAEWTRVLKDDGLLVLVVPHRDGTFDHRRPVTAFEHLVEDHASRIDEGDMTHLAEILAMTDLSLVPESETYEAFEQRSRDNREHRCLHHHVFDTRLAVRIVDHMGLQVLAVELFRPAHIVVVARKDTRRMADNATWLAEESPGWTSPFPTDARERAAA